MIGSLVDSEPGNQYRGSGGGALLRRRSALENVLHRINQRSGLPFRALGGLLRHVLGALPLTTCELVDHALGGLGKPFLQHAYHSFGGRSRLVLTEACLLRDHNTSVWIADLLPNTLAGRMNDMMEHGSRVIKQTMEA